MKRIFTDLEKNCLEMKDFISKCEKCYLYGTGKAAKLLISFMEKENLSITGFIVSNKDFDCFCGYPVYEVQDVQINPKNDGIILAVGEELQPEIIKHINQYIESVRIYGQRMFYRKIVVPQQNKLPVGDGYFCKFTDLDCLGLKNNTDKCSLAHNYLNKYELFLRRFTDRTFNLLELGVSKGASLKMWGDYFPKAKIYGIDIDKECKQYENENRNVLLMDLSEEENILRLTAIKPSIIVDDASHFWSHQIKALFLLFDALPHGGVYILEDIETSFLNAGFVGYDDAVISAYDVCSLIGEVATSRESLRSKVVFAEEIEHIGKQVEMISFIQGSCIMIKQ